MEIGKESNWHTKLFNLIEIKYITNTANELIRISKPHELLSF